MSRDPLSYSFGLIVVTPKASKAISLRHEWDSDSYSCGGSFAQQRTGQCQESAKLGLDLDLHSKMLGALPMFYHLQLLLEAQEP